MLNIGGESDMSKESVRIREIMKELSEMRQEMASLFHAGTDPEEINKLVLRGKN
jgi:hypothetical protein